MSRSSVYLIRALLVLALLVILASFAIKASSVVNYNSVVSTSKNLSTEVGNSISSLNIIPRPINSTWATLFFQNVSYMRGSTYSYCPALSEFAQTRFKTMAANPGISHYGYDQDFSKYWPGGYTFGMFIYTGFGEEVFYPSGSTPSRFVSQVISTAPGHWQELSDPNMTNYGFYIANGPAYEILGPGGGYGAACPVTEIPGPNINISQFFAQYGCSVELSNLTYFVIEIAPLCPQIS